MEIIVRDIEDFIKKYQQKMVKNLETAKYKIVNL